MNDAVNWYYNGPDQVFQIAGNPGTGKSVMLNAIIDAAKIDRNRIAPMAYTGAAANVMRFKGFANARTVHSWLLTPVQEAVRDKNGSVIKNDYFNIPEVGLGFAPKKLEDIDLIVIDEAGMIPAGPLQYAIEKHGIKILVAGDLDQLPPIGDKPAYLFSGKVHILDEIMRQARGSGIVYLSQRLKKGLPIHLGYYGDCYVVYDTDVTDKMVLNSDILICGKNETRQLLTDTIRKDIFHYGDGLPVHGERLVCRNNNWRLERDGINLTNGLVGCVSNYPDVTSFDKKTFTIDFKPNLINSVFEDLLIDYKYFSADFKDKQRLKYAKYSKGEKLEYAYAITAHISQGSQYANGMYFEEYLNKDINKNLHYTGITRFSNSCVYVKKKPKYY